MNKAQNEGKGEPVLLVDKSALNRMQNRLSREIDRVPKTGLSHTFVRNDGKHIVLSYNLFLHDEQTPWDG